MKLAPVLLALVLASPAGAISVQYVSAERSTYSYFDGVEPVNHVPGPIVGTHSYTTQLGDWRGGSAHYITDQFGANLVDNIRAGMASHLRSDRILLSIDTMVGSYGDEYTALVGGAARITFNVLEPLRIEFQGQASFLDPEPGVRHTVTVALEGPGGVLFDWTMTDGALLDLYGDSPPHRWHTGYGDYTATLTPGTYTVWMTFDGNSVGATDQLLALAATRVSFTPAPIPEPTTLALLGMGLAGLARYGPRARPGWYSQQHHPSSLTPR